MANIDSAYLIYKDGSTIYAKNGRTGTIDFQGADAKTIIQNALSKMTSGRTWREKVTILGDLSIDNTTSPLYVPDYTMFVLFGKMTAKDRTKSLIDLGSNVILENGVYSGNRGTTYDSGDNPIRVILCANKYNTIIRDLRVINGYGRGIQVNYPNNISVENVVIYNCKRNVMHNINSTDLSTYQGICYMRNIVSLNAIENGLDGTSPNLYVDGYYSRNCRTPIAIEGFKNIVLENIDVDKNINISTADTFPARVGVRAILNKIFAQNIFIRSKSPYESLTIDNAHLVNSSINGIEIVIHSNNDLEYIKINNTEITKTIGRGIYLRREDDTYTGTFKNIMLNNFIARDCRTIGAIFSHVDYLQINNSVVRGNGSKGFVIENCNYAKISNSNSIVKGVYSQQCPLYVEDTNHLKVVNCLLENGGTTSTLINVTDYDFDGCQGSYPILRKAGTALVPTGTNSITFAHGMVGIPKVTLGATHTEVSDAIVLSDDTNITIRVSKSVTLDRRINWFASIKIG